MSLLVAILLPICLIAFCFFLFVGVDDAVHVFRLESPAREVRIVSRSSVSAELDVASPDIRRLGVSVSRVVLSGDDASIVVGCGDASLVDGFHACEETHRRTDGDARVPATVTGQRGLCQPALLPQ